MKFSINMLINVFEFRTNMTLTKHKSLEEDEPGTYPAPKETDVD